LCRIQEKKTLFLEKTISHPLVGHYVSAHSLRLEVSTGTYYSFLFMFYLTMYAIYRLKERNLGKKIVNFNSLPNKDL